MANDFNLKETVKEIVGMMEYQASDKNLKLKVEYDGPEIIKNDRQRVSSKFAKPM